MEARVLDLRQSGHGYKDIAKQLGLDPQRVGYICRRHGLGGCVAGRGELLTDDIVADTVSKSGFDYVGGYTMAKKPIVVRCRKCGRTFERQYHIFRDVVNGTWTAGNECPLCREDQINEARRQRKEERERDARILKEWRERDKALLVVARTNERLANRVCKNCGTIFCIEATGYNSKKYCSQKCMKRWTMRVKNDRRIRKMMKRKHDTDITLENLYRRDNGICYLCGCTCEWNDITDGNAGNMYPSIDHVIPLAKGGTHTWDNVRLAHRGCNILKRDTVLRPRGQKK